MNILMINGDSDLYGAGKILLQVIKMLKSNKIFLIVRANGLLTNSIENNADYAHVSVIIEPSVPVIYRGMGIAQMVDLAKKVFSFKKSLKQIIQEKQIDWAYVNTLSCLPAVKLLKSLKIKVFVHVHEILENNKLLTRLINKSAMRWADKIIAVSDPVKLNLIDVCKPGETYKVTTILNGIPDEYAQSDSEFHNNESKITVTLIGRIKPEKGIWFFLDSILLLPDETIKKSNFIIVGGAAPGGEHFVEKLKKDIQLHPAHKHIRYISFIPNVAPILNSSDIIVVPSLMRDPFPTTILEALSAGKPVVATNNGGAIQSIKNNVTGFLIDPLNTKEFANRLQRLIQTDSLRERIGMKARQEFLENFTIKVFEKNLMNEVRKFQSAVN